MRTAGYAATLGTGYVFGHFMSEDNGKEVIQTYRSQFRMDHALGSKAPQVIIAVSVIIGETEDEARAWESVHHSFKGRNLCGTLEQVIQQLIDLQKENQNEEFLIVCPIPSYKERIIVYERLAEGWAAITT